MALYDGALIDFPYSPASTKLRSFPGHWVSLIPAPTPVVDIPENVQLAAVEVLAQDTLLVTFNQDMVNNDALKASASYVITPADAGDPVTIDAVLVSATEQSATAVVLALSTPTVGAEYLLTVSGALVSTAQTMFEPGSNLWQFVCRRTKMDRILNALPAVYTQTQGSSLRAVLHAVFREDDRIGGDREDYLE